MSPGSEAVTFLNKFIQQTFSTVDTALSFIPLDCKTIKLAVFTDASFAKNQDLSSQLEYILAFYDDSANVSILHHSSEKWKRLTRSVLVSELYAAVHGYDYASTVQLTINDILGRQVPLTCIQIQKVYLTASSTLEQRRKIAN